MCRPVISHYYYMHTIYSLPYFMLCTSSVTAADDAPIRSEATASLPGSVPSHSTSRAPGRIRGAALPQEYDLARFVENLEGLHPTWRTNVTACEWAGVTCNEMDEVKTIKWGSTSGYFSLVHGEIRGSVAWKYLPVTLTSLNIDGDKLRGEVVPKLIPTKLKTLSFSHNQFFGVLEMHFLPSSLEELYADHNELTGNINLTDLPPNLEELWLEENNFEGGVDLCHLPTKLLVLDFSCNHLSGTLDFRSLPDSLAELYAHDNEFESLVNVEYLSSAVRYCWVKNNRSLRGRVREIELPLGISFEMENTQIETI